jgi:hypothetical protein
MAENQTRKRIRVLDTNNGTEHINRDLQDYLKKCGTMYKGTVPTHQSRME